ncbi:MAG: BolA family transcriptional regulator [Chloroflexi bacterium]|nr:BolA family transcriptional regulator [Chloroflexota bacterium]
MKTEELKASIERSLPGSLVDVQDVKGTGDHFQVVVVAEQFAGASLVEQHQLVYRALNQEIEGDLHAIGLKTYTPDAWKKMQPHLR